MAPLTALFYLFMYRAYELSEYWVSFFIDFTLDCKFEDTAFIPVGGDLAVLWSCAGIILCLGCSLDSSSSGDLWLYKLYVSCLAVGV